MGLIKVSRQKKVLNKLPVDQNVALFFGHPEIPQSFGMVQIKITKKVISILFSSPKIQTNYLENRLSKLSTIFTLKLIASRSWKMDPLLVGSNEHIFVYSQNMNTCTSVLKRTCEYM